MCRQQALPIYKCNSYSQTVCVSHTRITNCARDVIPKQSLKELLQTSRLHGNTSTRSTKLAKLDGFGYRSNEFQASTGQMTNFLRHGLRTKRRLSFQPHYWGNPLFTQCRLCASAAIAENAHQRTLGIGLSWHAPFSRQVAQPFPGLATLFTA